MHQSSTEYFKRRERVERASAKRAISQEARAVHQELAQRYRALAESKDDPVHVDAPAALAADDRGWFMQPTARLTGGMLYPVYRTAALGSLCIAGVLNADTDGDALNQARGKISTGVGELRRITGSCVGSAAQPSFFLNAKPRVPECSIERLTPIA